MRAKASRLCPINCFRYKHLRNSIQFEFKSHDRSRSYARCYVDPAPQPALQPKD